MCNMLGQIYTERHRDRERQRDRKRERERERDFLDSASLRSEVTNARRVPASSSVHEGYRLFPRQRFPFNLANVFQGISGITMSEAEISRGTLVGLPRPSYPCAMNGAEQSLFSPYMLENRSTRRTHFLFDF